ncbi:methyltransferase type 11, partial [Arthrospira sp. O9.13F]
YLKDYATGSVDATLGAAGFAKVRSEDIWWINQVTVGLKPIINHSPNINSQWEQQPNHNPFPAPA